MGTRGGQRCVQSRLPRITTEVLLTDEGDMGETIVMAICGAAITVPLILGTLAAVLSGRED